MLKSFLAYDFSHVLVNDCRAGYAKPVYIYLVDELVVVIGIDIRNADGQGINQMPQLLQIIFKLLGCRILHGLDPDIRSTANMLKVFSANAVNFRCRVVI